MGIPQIILRSVDIWQYFDPTLDFLVNEPPLFSFINPNLEQGCHYQQMASIELAILASGVDALVKVVAIIMQHLNDIEIKRYFQNSPCCKF